MEQRSIFFQSLDWLHYILTLSHYRHNPAQNYRHNPTQIYSLITFLINFLLLSDIFCSKITRHLPDWGLQMFKIENVELRWLTDCLPHTLHRSGRVACFCFSRHETIFSCVRILSDKLYNVTLTCHTDRNWTLEKVLQCLHFWKCARETCRRSKMISN